MKKIFLLTFLIFTFSRTIHAEQILEEKKIDQNIKVQSAEDIINDLKAKKEAEKPFDDKDIKIDLESLGLDDVDKKIIKNKTDEIIKTVKESDLLDKTPQVARPVKTPDPTLDVQKQISAVTNSVNEKNASTFSKIKNLFSKDASKNIEAQNAAIPPMAPIQNRERLEPKAEKKPSLKQRIASEKNIKKNRIAKEKIAAENRRKLRFQEEKMIKLNRLRDEYLIKNPEEEINEDGYDQYRIKPVELLPQEKSFDSSEEFISYDPPPAPLLDSYRAEENSHIPFYWSPQDKVELLFKIISENSDGNPAAFQSAYKYVQNPNIRNQYGETILTYATLLQKYSIIESILAKGADPDLPNALGHTPLDIAIELLDLTSANILLKNNADIYYVDGFGRNYLMHAARVGFFPMVDLFVSQGINVNDVDNEGYSALVMAQRHKKELIVKYLIRNGAIAWTPKNFTPAKENMIEDLKTRWSVSRFKYRTE